MLFDVQAALAAVLRQAALLATPATLATNQAGPSPVSQLSRVSQWHPAGNTAYPFHHYGNGPTSLPSVPHPEIALRLPRPNEAARFPYGIAPNGNPRTWTGRIVSLDDWRSLLEWDWHGSTGKLWNALRGR